MRKYIHINLIIVITIILGIISQFNLGIILSSIIHTIAIICIVILAKKTNTYEENAINKISNVIYKILNISTILFIILTVGINLVTYTDITDTYKKLSNKDLLKFNTVAIKSIAIDVISTIDTLEYIASDEDTKEEIVQTYNEINMDTVFSEVIDTIDGIKNVDIWEILKSMYWLSSHFKKTRTLCILTVLAYISIIYRVKISKSKTV